MTTDFNFEVETKDVDNFMVSSRCASSWGSGGTYGVHINPDPSSVELVGMIPASSVASMATPWSASPTWV
jgi:hypothetical protein